MLRWMHRVLGGLDNYKLGDGPLVGQVRHGYGFVAPLAGRCRPFVAKDFRFCGNAQGRTDAGRQLRGGALARYLV